jgi:hypothetical protein
MASYPSHFVLSKAVRVVRFLLVTIASVAPSLAAKEDEVIEKKPNIIVIMTDEHNLKTLGCYRDLLGDEQAYPWGPGVNMETPNMDSLASGGGGYIFQLLLSGANLYSSQGFIPHRDLFQYSWRIHK